MRIAGAALILALLLSAMICQGEENRDQEKDDPATENFYFVVGIVFVIASFVAIPCCIMRCFC